MDPAERTVRLIEIMQKIVEPGVGWVLFDQGTCVLCRKSGIDLKEHAIEVLKEWGPVVPGTPLGDFDFKIHDNPSGILVTYYEPDILTFLMEDEVEDLGSPLGGALAARYRRGEDAQTLRIVHIEEPASIIIND
jgi:hypothetical protein